MRSLGTTLAAVVLLSFGQTEAAAGEDQEWQMFGRVLALVQSVVHEAAKSNDPRAVEKSLDSLLSGEHAEANRLAGDLLGTALDDIPARYKVAALALARDLTVIARKERARRPSGYGPDADTALQARKDLTSMGLRYYDAGQFLDAVKRNDVLAVELFLAARGVDAGTRDADGLTALELAQRRNNRQIVDLLATVKR